MRTEFVRHGFLMRFWRVGISVAILGISLFQIVRFWPATIDDAFISFRYAVHWAQGLGLTFNAGERVEGFSNFLWVAIVAGLAKLGLDPVPMTKIAGLLSLVALLFFAWRALAGAGYAGFAPGAALGLLAASNGYLVFLSVTGLETVFYAALLMAIVDSLRTAENRLTPVSALLLVLVALTRPEGIAYAVVLAPVLWWLRRDRERRPSGWWLAVVGAYAVFLVCRRQYFGAWWPNTFYAKPSPTGLYGVAGVLAGTWLALPELARLVAAAGGPLLALLAVYAATARQTRRKFLPLTAVVATGLAFQFYAGPDWMQLGRFLVPVWTPLVVLGLAGWQELGPKLGQTWTHRGLALWVGLTVVLNLSASGQFWAERRSYPNFVLTSEDMISASQWIAAHYPSTYSIVCWRIGALGYYTGLDVIDDEWGLTDTYVARLRHAGQLTEAARDRYLAGRNPELALRRSYAGEDAAPGIHIGGREYRFVRRFAQGSDEWWDLYERSELVVK